MVALAKAEKALGINITDEQIAELEANKDKINYEIAREREKLVRHDVMSHVYAYGCECQMQKESSIWVQPVAMLEITPTSSLCARVWKSCAESCSMSSPCWQNLPSSTRICLDLAYTHLQPAQLTTVGKRATLWINELLNDEQEIEARIKSLKLLGSKGTTGTQASFMELFNGDEEKCKKAEQMIAQEMGFESCVPVSGQTYSRKMDYYVLSNLSCSGTICQQILQRYASAAKL